MRASKLVMCALSSTQALTRLDEALVRSVQCSKQARKALARGDVPVAWLDVTAADDAVSVAAFDADGDGDMDLASGSWGDIIAWYENTDGRGSFSTIKRITTEAYGPLGVGNLLSNPAVTAIAEAQGKTAAQVLIRWSLQLGNVVIPRSSSPERIAANLDVFGFELTDDQMASLNGLDNGTRFRPDPETYTGA